MTRYRQVGMTYDGAIATLEHLETGRRVQIPWPPPPVTGRGWGWWEPARVGTAEDGTAVMLWRWQDQGPPDRRADEPPKEDE